MSVFVPMERHRHMGKHPYLMVEFAKEEYTVLVHAEAVALTAMRHEAMHFQDALAEEECCVMTA